MDWKLFSATYISVFLAELGDKTQLATMALSGESGKAMVVFAGSAFALATSALIAALLGNVVNKVVDPIWITRAAGSAFVIMGCLMLVKSIRS